MNVYCVIKRFQCKVEAHDGAFIDEDFEILEAIFDEEPKARKYIASHSAKLQERMNIQMWAVQ